MCCLLLLTLYHCSVNLNEWWHTFALFIWVIQSLHSQFCCMYASCITKLTLTLEYYGFDDKVTHDRIDLVPNKWLNIIVIHCVFVYFQHILCQLIVSNDFRMNPFIFIQSLFVVHVCFIKVYFIENNNASMILSAINVHIFLGLFSIKSRF